MNTTCPQKWFPPLCNKHHSRSLLGRVIFCFLIVAVPVLGQEPPRLIIPQGISAENSTLQLTPSGQLAAPGRLQVDRPISISPLTIPVDAVTPVLTTPLKPLPKLVSTDLPAIGQEELEQIRREGQTLESDARWSEALAYYESVLRTHRNEATVMELYRVARFHCDIGRRYQDTSYLGLIQSLTVIETLNFFEDVMMRIQKNYALTPQWEQLFRHGVQSYKIALSDANFRAKVGLNISNDRVNAYLSGVQATINGWSIQSKDDVKNGLFHIAEGAQKQIGLNPVVVLMEITCGIVNSLDPNTAYLTPNQLNDQYAALSGNLVGLGVELRSDRTALQIVKVIRGSPADEGGLKEGDRILTVDGTTTRGRDTDSAADLLQGKEGTTVKLEIQAERLGQRSREVSITRRKIEVPSVEDVRMINETLGYIRLASFQLKTGLEMSKALHELNRQGMQWLVLDLRRNPGGSFQVGIEVADMFIKQGAIVRTQGRDRGPDSPYMATGRDTWDVELIVLIDEESASAAEIVAGAIRDHDRGTLIGRRSYGKGTVQQILPVRTGTTGNVQSGVKLTVEKFYSPNGWSYSGVGVTPHVIIGEEESQRHIVARTFDGRSSPLPRPATSNLDDPYIQEAVRVSQSLAK
ncbi:MAG: S41 family peptidase [Planctomycetaceae bacterium]|nr:S41 family peptidase [Planctomycetaceae bacterium]